MFREYGKYYENPSYSLGSLGTLQNLGLSTMDIKSEVCDLTKQNASVRVGYLLLQESPTKNRLKTDNYRPERIDKQCDRILRT